MTLLRRRRWFWFLLAVPGVLLGLSTLHSRLVEPYLAPPALPTELALEARDLLLAAQAASGAPGVGVALVRPTGAEAIHVVGSRERDGDGAIASGDPWHLGSDGKAMVAAVYARLVEQGRARWGATIPELFPDLARRIDPAWRTITIDDLLTHRAGVSDVGLRSRLLGMWFDARPLDAQRTGLARGILASPPRGAPGGFAYANLSYVLAGAAIERVAGVPFELVMVQELFRPLGLSSAGFGAPEGDAPRGHGRSWLPFLPAGPMAPDRRFADNPPALGPAGRIHMSLADWGRFAAIFLQGDGEGFLRAGTVRKLLTPPAGEGDYAYGWTKVPDFGTPVLAHNGSNTLWFAAAMIAPERGVAVLVAANDGAESSKAIMPALARRLLGRALHDRSLSPQRRSSTASSSKDKPA